MQIYNNLKEKLQIRGEWRFALKQDAKTRM